MTAKDRYTAFSVLIWYRLPYSLCYKFALVFELSLGLEIRLLQQCVNHEREAEQGNPNPMIKFFAEGTGQLNYSTCLNFVYQIYHHVRCSYYFLWFDISFEGATDLKIVWSFSLSPVLVFVLLQFLSFCTCLVLFKMCCSVSVQPFRIKVDLIWTDQILLYCPTAMLLCTVQEDNIIQY